MLPNTRTMPDHKTAADIKWFHSYQFPDGEQASGFKPLVTVREEADVFLRCPLEGKTVLDVGAWDGYYSFEAERRGARRVLATDHECWSGPGWGTKDGFDYAHRKFNSRVESLDIDVPDISPQTVGTFDVVLFLGVLYHLKNPLLGIEAVASVASDLVIIETVTTLNELPEPVMRYYLGDEMAGDASNFWAPNLLCLQQMFREFGFTRFEAMLTPNTPAPWTRHIVQARR